MINNINTRTKLLLFPLMFLIIVVISGFIYSHYSGVQNTRTHVAMKTDEFIQQLLKGRISVYQFLRAPTDVNEQKVVDNFKVLDDEVTKLKLTLSAEKNKVLSDEIVASSKEYVNNFKIVSSKMMINQKME